MSGVVHLLPAGELFERDYPRTCVAVCGEPVTTVPDSDEEDPGYRAECVRAAIVWRAPVAGERGRR